jgi:hypothetical protein
LRLLDRVCRLGALDSVCRFVLDRVCRLQLLCVRFTYD